LNPIFTLGHGTRRIEEFLEILRAFHVRMIVDVRTVPRSRHNPQYDQMELQKVLEENGFAYQHLKALGGLRHAHKDSINTGWQNASFRGYADYMQTPEFAQAIKKLISLGKRRKIAILCAESVPWRCHRSMIADALVVRGVEVLHIMSKTNAHAHALTPFARVAGEEITYPAS